MNEILNIFENNFEQMFQPYSQDEYIEQAIPENWLERDWENYFSRTDDKKLNEIKEHLNIEHTEDLRYIDLIEPLFKGTLRKILERGMVKRYSSVLPATAKGFSYIRTIPIYTYIGTYLISIVANKKDIKTLAEQLKQELKKGNNNEQQL